MTSKRTNFVKFSHSCVRTPLHPKSRAPMPLYERKMRDEERDAAAATGDDNNNCNNSNDNNDNSDDDEEEDDEDADDEGTVTPPPPKPEDRRYINTAQTPWDHDGSSEGGWGLSQVQTYVSETAWIQSMSYSALVLFHKI